MAAPIPMIPTNRDDPAFKSPQPLAQGQIQANQLQQTQGDLKSYMAARGAQPIGGLGAMTPQAPASSPLYTPDRGFQQAQDMNTALRGARAANPPARPMAVNPNQPPRKGRTTSMQRRGAGVGQPRGNPQPNTAPRTPMTAATDFLTKPSAAVPVPLANPLGAQPAGGGPAPPTRQPALVK